MRSFTKTICVLLLCTILVPQNVLAATSATETEACIYFEDGSYISIEISAIETRSSTIKRGNKTYIYKNSDGVEQWRAVLYGTFTYTGTSSTCTASSCSVTTSNSNWYEVSKTIGKSGSSATAELVMGRKLLGITVDKETVNMILTCDANGNLS